MGNENSVPWDRILVAKEYSDLTIKCQTETFHVHRVIVCVHSSVIKAAVDGNIKDSVSVPMELTLDDNDPKALGRMIKFIYQQYTPYKKGHSPLICAQDYLIAEKFNLARLKNTAYLGYLTVLGEEWRTAFFLSSLEFLLKELPAADISYSQGDILASAVYVAALHINDLKDSPRYKNICEKHTEFAQDVLVATTDLGLCKKHLDLVMNVLAAQVIPEPKSFGPGPRKVVRIALRKAPARSWWSLRTLLMIARFTIIMEVVRIMLWAVIERLTDEDFFY